MGLFYPQQATIYHAILATISLRSNLKLYDFKFSIDLHTIIITPTNMLCFSTQHTVRYTLNESIVPPLS